MHRVLFLIFFMSVTCIYGQKVSHDWHYERNSIKVMRQLNEVILRDNLGDTLKWTYEITKNSILPIDTKEKAVWYYYYVIKQEAKKTRHTDTPLSVNGDYMTLEPESFSFEVSDWGNKKNSYFFEGRVSMINYQRTPILNIRVYRNGEYTMEKIKTKRKLRRVKKNWENIKKK